MEKFRYCKLEIFVPEENLGQIEAALWAVDAGHIGKSRYDSYLKLYESYSQVKLWELKK